MKLSAPFSSEDVTAALTQINTGKGPGFDGDNRIPDIRRSTNDIFSDIQTSEAADSQRNRLQTPQE